MHGTTINRQKGLRNNFSAVKNGQRIFKYLKSWQKENFPSRIVNKETKEVATTDYNKTKLFKRYFVSIVVDPDYSFFIPSKEVECGDITFYTDEFEISKDLHRLNISESR